MYETGQVQNIFHCKIALCVFPWPVSTQGLFLFMQGWIKLHRKLLEWEWFNDSNMVHVFLYLILKANHKPKKWRGQTIERGQVLTGRKVIAKDTGIAEQSVRTCLKRLKSTSEITSKSTNRFSIITVCNYDSYQVQEATTNQQINQPANQQVTSNQPTTNQQVTTTKNDKKEKNVKNEKKEGGKIASRFRPPTILECQVYFQTKMFSGNANAEAERFWNYYESNGWKVGKNKMQKWKSAAANWILKINDNGKQIPGEKKRVWTPEDFAEPGNG